MSAAPWAARPLPAHYLLPGFLMPLPHPAPVYPSVSGTDANGKRRKRYLRVVKAAVSAGLELDCFKVVVLVAVWWPDAGMAAAAAACAAVAGPGYHVANCTVAVNLLPTCLSCS